MIKKKVPTALLSLTDIRSSLKISLYAFVQPTVHLPSGREATDAVCPAEQPSPDDSLRVHPLVLHHHHGSLRYFACFCVQGPDSGDIGT